MSSYLWIVDLLANNYGYTIYTTWLYNNYARIMHTIMIQGKCLIIVSAEITMVSMKLIFFFRPQ